MRTKLSTRARIHSKFLVHWTGKDITATEAPSKFTSEESNEFIKRLKSIIKKGLIMGRKKERIYGKENTWVQIEVPRVCFTEIKLSQALDHAKKYGFLGIGFNRKFVLSRYGNPVFYVQNGQRGIAVENLSVVHGHIKHNSNGLKALEIILGFTKDMSDKDSLQLEHYDEMEWRILHSDLLEKEGHIVKEENTSILKFRPQNIKIIVFPNNATRKKALEDLWLKEHFFSKNIPVITTVYDCAYF